MRALLRPLIAVSFLAALLTGCGGPDEIAAASTGRIVDGRYVGEDGKLRCPVMNVAIESEDEAFAVSEHDGARYFLCCASCKPAFDANPAQFVPAAVP
jgi:YHS domain-containing protein